jgi:hypothetical protein
MVPNHDRAVANRPIAGSAPLLCGIGTAKKFADPSHIAREGLSLMVGEPTKGQFMRSCQISVSENIRHRPPTMDGAALAEADEDSSGLAAQRKLVQPSFGQARLERRSSILEPATGHGDNARFAF